MYLKNSASTGMRIACALPGSNTDDVLFESDYKQRGRRLLASKSKGHRGGNKGTAVVEPYPEPSITIVYKTAVGGQSAGPGLEQDTFTLFTQALLMLSCPRPLLLPGGLSGPLACHQSVTLARCGLSATPAANGPVHHQIKHRREDR